jgi:hypothetical protein
MFNDRSLTVTAQLERWRIMAGLKSGTTFYDRRPHHGRQDDADADRREAALDSTTNFNARGLSPAYAEASTALAKPMRSRAARRMPRRAIDRLYITGLIMVPP